MRIRRTLTLAALFSLFVFASLSASGEEPPVEPCPLYPPTSEYRVRVGYAKGKNAAEAISEARRDARSQLEDQICKGIETQPRCLAARANIFPYGEGSFQKKERSACASVAISNERLNSRERDLAQLEAATTAAGIAIADNLKGEPVRFEAPVWKATGCSGGELGAYLQAAIQAHLGSTPILDQSDIHSSANLVRVELSSGGGRILASSLVKRKGQAGWIAVEQGSLSLPDDLFPRPERCVSEQSLDLVGGNRPGASGLRVSLNIGTGAAQLCEGEKIRPEIQVSQAARVRVYSVQADGVGYQIWPFLPQEDLTYGHEHPPEMPASETLRTFDDSDDRLVVAAWADGDPSIPPPGFCRLKAPLRARDFPPGVALSTVAFHVARADALLCSGRGDPAVAQQASHTREFIENAPLCP